MLTRATGWFLLMLIGCGGATALWAARPEPPLAVSPGNSSQETLEESRCPTFSWSQVPAARGYELTVYRIVDGSRGLELVLRHELPRLVSSWTPSLDRCLERGERYAWSVSALAGGAESAWSAPNLFRIAEPGPAAAWRECPAPFVGDATAEPPVSSARADDLSTVSARRPDSAALRPSASTPERPDLDAAVPIAEEIGLSVEVPSTAVKTVALAAVVASAQNGSAGVLGRSTALSGSTAGLVGECGFYSNFSCVGVKGFSGTGNAVFGESDTGTGVVGYGMTGVEGSSAAGSGIGLSGVAFSFDGVGVRGKSEDGTGFGGVFVNNAGGLLIVADNDDNYWSDPVFSVANDGTTHATAFAGDGGALTNLGVLVVSRLQEENNNSSNQVSSSCDAGESLVSGACDCWASTILKSHPNSGGDGWDCLCSAYGSRSAWAFCLDVP